jgi:uncharacterized damage-inducible protein DinB
MCYLFAMFRYISDFLKAWDYESASTLKVLRALDDSSLDQRVTPDGRTLGVLAWHILTTLSEMPGQAGLEVQGPRAEDPAPASAAGIVAAYEGAAHSVAEAVKSSWKDSQLAEEIPMYGERWTRGATLSALIAHQCHHRGQMTVLMRQAGLKVPGVYGPAKEEWTAFGMQAQA